MDEIESWPCDSSEYSLEHLIGRGSFAKVYTATCAKKRSDGVQRVALKVMDLEHINTEIADISKEVQMMRMCHHSNVLCCHASFVSKSELFERCSMGSSRGSNYYIPLALSTDLSS